MGDSHIVCQTVSQGLASKHHDLTADHMIALLAMRDNMSKSKVKQVNICSSCYHDVISSIVYSYNILLVYGYIIASCYAYYFELCT